MNCKLCHREFRDSPAIILNNMPAGAQSFLTKAELDSDVYEDFRLYSCPNCGLLQVDAPPVPYYRDCIRASGLSEEMAKEKTEYYREIFDKYDLIGKEVVEIGCGNGEFLRIIKAAGANPYGIEHKIDAVEQLNKEGYKVLKAYPGEDDMSELENRFEGFTCTQFLEHAPNPALFLSGIAGILKDNAVGIVEVPNFDMMKEKLLMTEFIADHVMYFTSDTLRLMLEVNGFTVLSCEQHWHDYVLTAVVRKRSKADLTAFNEEKERLVKELNSFVSSVKSANRRLAVWGASHQALAIIGIAGIADSIEYIVDSAPFKQGLYTPGSHLYVAAPDNLKEDPVDTVLIMAASYNEEVAAIMHRDYPDREVYMLEGTRIIKG